MNIAIEFLVKTKKEKKVIEVEMTIVLKQHWL
jgi:hypothetical protein